MPNIKLSVSVKLELMNRWLFCFCSDLFKTFKIHWLLKELFEFDSCYKIESYISNPNPENEHRFLVIGRKKDFEIGGKEKLHEILNAIGWKENENCSIIEIEDAQPILISSFLVKKDHVVITFGLTEKELCLQSKLPKYFHANFENALLIRSDSLTEIKEKKELKIQLWNSIKDLKS